MENRLEGLAKLYIEPTIQCNLDCRTCIRNVWDEPAAGKMQAAVFDSIIDGLRSLPTPPKIFFGGFGEPLLHPGIVDMVARVKPLSTSVELITNATLLTPGISKGLITAGLDVLWLSLDGATPENYADIRLGAALSQVLENIASFRKVQYSEYARAPHKGGTVRNNVTQLGIAFVAMKRNITDLPEVIDIGRRMGAHHYLVSNVLPYTKEMVEEVLNYRALDDINRSHFNFTAIATGNTSSAQVVPALQGNNITFTISNSKISRDRCPFIESGACAVSWDGNLSPCLPLLHSHTSYLSNLDRAVSGERFSRRWIIGNVGNHDLSNLWNRPEYTAFRERVRAFNFPPCTNCGGCNLSFSNEQDCFGNEFPTCGGCLWSRGVVQCP